MNLIKKVKFWFKILTSGFFTGLKSADEVISQKANYGSTDTDINEYQKTDSVFQDFINGEETERVQEERDRYYRVYREADKYQVEVLGDINNENSPLSATARKKERRFYRDYTILESDYDVRVIQDNKTIERKSSFFYEINDFKAAEEMLVTQTIEVKRDDFLPRFSFERFAKKIIVFNKNEKEALLDLYFSIYAEQFNSVSGLFISEMNKIYNGQKDYETDTFKVKNISFITDKAFGAEDMCLFEYNNISFEGVEIFDGNFVVHLTGNIVNDGKDLTEQYKTDSLSRKYKNKEMKKNVINFDAAAYSTGKEKENETINFETKKFYLKNEDSHRH